MKNLLLLLLLLSGISEARLYAQKNQFSVFAGTNVSEMKLYSNEVSEEILKSSKMKPQFGIQLGIRNKTTLNSRLNLISELSAIQYNEKSTKGNFYEQNNAVNLGIGVSVNFNKNISLVIIPSYQRNLSTRFGSSRKDLRQTIIPFYIENAAILSSGISYKNKLCMLECTLNSAVTNQNDLIFTDDSGLEGKVKGFRRSVNFNLVYPLITY